jgi:methionine sulfoxide reductase heme-binding subunit
LDRQLGADPQEKMLHQLGLWTLIYLLIGLSITPLSKIFKKGILVKFRRMMGLYAFLYLILHLTVFFIFYLETSLAQLWDEIIERPYVTVGMMATILFIPLVVTSTRGMQRKLGRRWKKLHQLTYLIALLAIIHFIWQSKSDLNEPLLYFIWLAIVLGYRWYKSRQYGNRV